MTDSDPVTAGDNCDSPTPYGQTYKNLGDTAGPSGGSSSSSNSSAAVPIVSSVAPGAGIFAEGASAASQAAASTPSADPVAAPVSSSALTGAAMLLNSINPTSANPVVATPNTQTFNGSSTYLAYASAANSSSYLPCVPGTFLCLSSASYYLCDQAASVSPFTPLSKLIGPFIVSDGMACVPYLAQFLDPTTAGKFANNSAFPQGWNGSDRYVGAGSP